MNFKERASQCGINLSSEQLEAFEKYRQLLQEWGGKINITTILDDKGVDNRHFLDSLSIFREIRCPSQAKVMDIGSGGGFPAIPMKIYDPSIQLTCLDGTRKKVDFLQQVIQELEMEDAEAIHGRAEEIFQQAAYREQYDIGVARAVASLPTLLEYCLPAVKVGGFFYAMKGPDMGDELKNSSPALSALGGQLVKVDHFIWTEERLERNIICIKKISPTPRKYPRSQGKPRKKPLGS